MTLMGRELRSEIDADGTLTLSFAMVEFGDLAKDEIIVRIEATPINPSDLSLLLGPADMSTLKAGERNGQPALTFSVAENRRPAIKGRLGKSLAIGNEGAGKVVAAGAQARHLEGKLVGMFGGATFADYRKIKIGDVMQLPEGTSAADGASMFVNPLTALGFVETARSEGHKAIVHTAAASNLGQMLQKVCASDGVPLINIVRSAEQVEILRGIGAQYVLNSKDGDFSARLTDAIGETGASIAFDAIGGGELGSDILQAMERAAVDRMDDYNKYGSDMFKQLYIYGALDLGPTKLNRVSFGFQWSVGGWLLFPFLRKAGHEVADRLRKRVTDELSTTFASRYTRTIGLAQILEPDVLRASERKTTGEKFLIDPTRN